MGKYVNGTFVPDENDLLLQQQQKMAGLQSAPQPQQAVSQPAPVTQPNPEVAEFAKAKTNNQSNNSPRVAGQAGTVYNIFKQQVPKEAADKMQQLENESRKAGAVIDEGPGYVNQGAGNRGGGQNQPITSTEDLARALGYTSPEEEEKMRKASVANQRIMAVADALRQIGNIYNTVHYAPSQQFNSPVEMERQRYQQAKALRDRANQTYISYQQAKEQQEAKQRQWEKDYEYKQGLLGHYRDQEERLREKDAFDKENKEARRDLDREKFELDKAYKQGKINIAQYNAQTSRIRAVKSGRAGGGGGGKYWAYDPEGNIHYYPNRTMWEQGIAEFGNGYDQTETLTNTNASGDQTQREVKVKSTAIGGNLARKAHRGSNVGSFSIRNNNQGNQKGTNVSRFTIHKQE